MFKSNIDEAELFHPSSLWWARWSIGKSDSGARVCLWSDIRDADTVDIDKHCGGAIYIYTSNPPAYVSTTCTLMEGESTFSLTTSVACRQSLANSTGLVCTNKSRRVGCENTREFHSSVSLALPVLPTQVLLAAPLQVLRSTPDVGLVVNHCQSL